MGQVRVQDYTDSKAFLHIPIFQCYKMPTDHFLRHSSDKNSYGGKVTDEKSWFLRLLAIG